VALSISNRLIRNQFILHYHPSVTDHCNISDATRYLIGTYDKQLYTFFDKYDIFDKYDN